ncbi:hypothetical protein H9C73_09415 [Marinobacterium sp. AK62]|uniref:Phytochrome chromophore attachment site domain-containing protein n=1 Tax=Marinobacterium alkalitolerans TaxID=1542925 RepID=A0ABS3ZB82_9GAMM|nr:hypothetical protein [Marinobacterium alkalitolerans]MBP0048956.1 hypothetical protein [Marinobacterium alkalitolerans]
MSVTRGFLAQCEREALQFSGHVQAGCALIVASPEFVVTHVSDNLSEFVTSDSCNVGQVLHGELRYAAESLGATTGSRYYLEQLGGLGDGPVEAVLNRGESGEILIDITPFRGRGNLYEFDLLESVRSHRHLASMRQALVEWIANVTGFRRVMYYQFLEGGDGVVLTEVTRDEQAGTYAGLRFPASDIPQIARDIYLRNPWRSIIDASKEPVPVRGGGVLNLTYTDMRSVSPVHSIYMQNMGDLASFSLPIIMGQGLDALVSCHDDMPSALPLPVKRLISSKVRQFNVYLRDFNTRQKVRLLDETGYELRKELRDLSTLSGEAVWERFNLSLRKRFNAEGVAWLYGNRCLQAGLKLSEDQLAWIDDWFTQQSREFVFTTDHFRGWSGQDWLTEVAGAAGVRLRYGRESVRLYFFRTEQIAQVSWGGNPDKPAEFHDGELGIAPRHSFSRWVEKRIGYSEPWTREVRLQLLRLRDELQSLDYPIELPGFARLPEA